MTRNIGIFGTSGMALEVGDIAYALGLNPIFIAKDEAVLSETGDLDHVILEKDLPRNAGLSCVIGIGDGGIRKSVVKRYKNVVEFVNLIHPSATFGRGQRDMVENSEGVIVAAGARFTCNTAVGDHCIINQNATIAHDCIIESYSHVGSGANVSGNVFIGSQCWIGAGAVINQGTPEQKLKIGHATLIGSGSVVTKSCLKQSVYAGVPARKLR